MISSIKRPEMFLSLSKFIPEAHFEMIGGRTKIEPQLYDSIGSESKRIPNLNFRGFIRPSRIENFFREASVFVNTSTYEGFPNTFIQAWSHNVPVVSLTVDPDEIIKKEGIGFRSGSFDKLVSDVRTLVTNDDLRRNMGGKSRKYVEREHDIKVVTDKYLELFEGIR